jgi:hypothetical protein
MSLPVRSCCEQLEDAPMLRAIKKVPDWLLIVLVSKAITTLILLS